MEHATQVAILKELMQQLDEGKNIDAGKQVRMSTKAYVCPDIAAKEQESFFRNHPQLIGLSGPKRDAETRARVFWRFPLRAESN